MYKRQLLYLFVGVIHVLSRSNVGIALTVGPIHDVAQSAPSLQRVVDLELRFRLSQPMVRDPLLVPEGAFGGSPSRARKCVYCSYKAFAAGVLIVGNVIDPAAVRPWSRVYPDRGFGFTIGGHHQLSRCPSLITDLSLIHI